MPSVLSSRSAYKPAYTAAPSSKKTGYSFNSYGDGGDDDDDDATAGSPPYHLGTSPADRKKKVFSSALQDIALSIRQALSTPKPSPDPSPARPSGTEGAAGGVVARTSTESEWLHSAEDLGDGGQVFTYLKNDPTGMFTFREALMEVPRHSFSRNRVCGNPANTPFQSR